ncbi:Protein RTM1 [Dictyocoela roeselum]|nr:Protein RTM1 [Dictyocoela roeselum]
MSCCIILAPVGLAFTDYLLVGRLIRTAGHQYSVVNAKFVEIGFIISDFLSIGIQSAGAGLVSRGTLAENLDEANTGSRVLIGGLVINLISFCFFAIVTFHFHWSISRHKAGFTGREKWVKMFYALYLSIILLIIRSVYRIVEFSMGFRGYIATHELYFYIFE